MENQVACPPLCSSLQSERKRRGEKYIIEPKLGGEGLEKDKNREFVDFL